MIQMYGVAVVEQRQRRKNEEMEIFELKQRDRNARLRHTQEQRNPSWQMDESERRKRRELEAESEASSVVEHLKQEMMRVRKRRLDKEAKDAKERSDAADHKLCARCKHALTSIDPQDIPPAKRYLLGGLDL